MVKFSTQHARTPMCAIPKKTLNSLFRALNTKQVSDPVGTDTVYGDTLAIDNGFICAQIFITTEPLVTNAHSMKTDKQFVNTLEGSIRQRNTIDKLVNDRVEVEISKRVHDISRVLFIDK